MTGRHPDLDEFDRAVADFETQGCGCICPDCRDRQHCAGVYCEHDT